MLKFSHFLLYTIIYFFTLPLVAQNSSLTLEDVFVNDVYKEKSINSINWINNSKNYLALVENKILKFNTTDDDKGEVIFDGNNYEVLISEYTLSNDEKRLLILTDKKKIYRRSYSAEYFIFNLETKNITKVSKNGRQQYATFSPDGLKVAFVRDNDLFYLDIMAEKETLVSKNGEKGKIINGSTDWVYEEEFEFVKAFFWSPESDKLAYYTFDETNVKEYKMQVWDSLYPQYLSYKYPKAGEENSRVSIKIYHLKDSRTVNVNLGSEKDFYIPKVTWTSNNDILSLIKLNRLQNKFEIIHSGANSGMSDIILLELYSKNYFDINFCNELYYLEDGKHFIYSSEQSGYKHFYAYDFNEKEIAPITTGPWEADKLVGVDDKAKVLYYTSTEKSPLERHLYKIGLNGKGKKMISTEEGTHEIEMSPDNKYYIDKFSNHDQPTTYSLYNSDGKMIKILESNAQVKSSFESNVKVRREYLTMSLSDTVELNGYIIKPVDFQEGKEYPLMMFLYGGPGSQKAVKQWGGLRGLYHYYLAQQGYVIACFDNRGTGGKGAKFKKVTFKQLGKYETQDQIEVAKKLGEYSYIDKSRIGIWGWSYGGFMSSSCLFKGNDVFKMAISVAPVTNWRYYDNVYTERYMQRPRENESGYDDNSPINFAEGLKGDFLLIHGTGDDNVHFQNAVELQDKLIGLGKQFDSFYYPNRSHSISENNASIHIYTKMARYIFDKL